jgi:hypothetical protein
VKLAAKEKVGWLWSESFEPGRKVAYTVGATPSARRAFLDECLATFKTEPPPPDRGWPHAEDALRVFGPEGLQRLEQFAQEQGPSYVTWARTMLEQNRLSPAALPPGSPEPSLRRVMPGRAPR